MNTADTSTKAREDPTSITSPSSPLPSSRPPTNSVSHKASPHPSRGGGGGGGGAKQSAASGAQRSASSISQGAQTHHPPSPVRSRPRSNAPNQHTLHAPQPHGVAAVPALVGAAGTAGVAPTVAGGGGAGGPAHRPPHLAPQLPPMMPYYHPSMYYGAPGDVVGMQYPPLGHLHGPPPDQSQGLHQNRQLYPHGNTNPPIHYPMGQPPHARQPYPPMHAPTSVPLPALGPQHHLHEPPGLASNVHIAPVERILSQETSSSQRGASSPPAPSSVGSDSGAAAATAAVTSPGPTSGLQHALSPTTSSSSLSIHATSHKSMEDQGTEYHQSNNNQSTPSSLAPLHTTEKKEDIWEHEQDRVESDPGTKGDAGQHDHEDQFQTHSPSPATGKLSHSNIPTMAVKGAVGGIPSALPTYGYPIPFYGATVPPMYNMAAGPRGQMGYPVPGQAPSMMPASSSRPLNAPPPLPPHGGQPHNFKHSYMAGGSAYPAEYGPGGHYMPPEHWPAFPPHQSLQKKPKELDKAMWVGNVSSDTTVADLQAIFEAPPTEEEGAIEVDMPESIFILSKSNCAFVNYATHEAVHRAVKRFHDREFKNTRLVCRPRKDPGGSDSYGSRHTSAPRYQPPPPQQHTPSSRPAPSPTVSGDGGGEDHDTQSHSYSTMHHHYHPQEPQQSTTQEFNDKEHSGQNTLGTDTMSVNMNSLRQEVGPAPEPVLSSGGGGPGGGGGGGGFATPKERDGRSRHARPGRSFRHISDLKNRSRSSSTSAHHAENRYFILKGLNEEDLKLSVQYGLWATQDHLVPVLNQAFANSNNVYLIFSANKSGEFFGYARMMDAISQEKHDHIFKSRAETNWMPSIAIPLSPELKAEVARYIEEAEAEGRTITCEEAEAVAVGSTPTKTWGIVFPIQWLFVHKVPFTATSHLNNPYYDNREVKLSKDGTEVEPTVGEQLLAVFRKHRELKKSASGGSNSASGISSPVGSDSGGIEDSRRSSLAGGEPGGDKRESAVMSPNPQLTGIRRSSTQSSKSAESGLTETPPPSTSTTTPTTKSPLMPAAQQHSQEHQQQPFQPTSEPSPILPAQSTVSTQANSHQSTRKGGGGYYSQSTGPTHSRSQYNNPMQSGSRGTGPPGGVYRPQLQYGPGPYAGFNQGHGPYGQWQGKAGPRNGGGQEFRPPTPTSQMSAQGTPTQDQHLPSSANIPSQQQQHHHHHHYSSRRSQGSSRFYQHQQQYPGGGGATGPYGPSETGYPVQYPQHHGYGAGAGYEYPAPPGVGQYYNQSYPQRRRNQGPASGYRHNQSDLHGAGGPYAGGGYKHPGGGGPLTAVAAGTQDGAGQTYTPGPNSPPHGGLGYRMAQPHVMNAYPGLPPVMGYHFHHQGQPTFIPVPVAWHPTQVVPVGAPPGEVAAGGAASATSPGGKAVNGSGSSISNPASSGGIPPVAGMAMMMGPAQGYPGAAYAPYPALAPTMAQAMSTSGDMMIEGMVPTALGYEGIQYMYIPAEMADAYHQPMYYYGHMPMHPDTSLPGATPPTAPEAMTSSSEDAKDEGVDEEEHGLEQREDVRAAGAESKANNSGESNHGNGEGFKDVSEQETSSLGATVAAEEPDVKENSHSSNGSNASNGGNGRSTPCTGTPTTIPSAGKKTRKTKKVGRGSPDATAIEMLHS